MISSWLRKVLSIPKAHLYPCTLQGVVASVALVVGVSLFSILQVGGYHARVSTPTKHYFFNIPHNDKLAPAFSSAFCLRP